MKKDTLWVKWVNEFFVRGGPIWKWSPPRDATTIFKSLACVRDEMITKKGSATAAIVVLEPWVQGYVLSVSRVYEWLSDHGAPRPSFCSI